VISYRTRSAVRDVGKALGLGLEQIEAIVAAVSAWRRHGEITDEALAEAGFDPSNPTLQRLRVLVNLLRGFPRHLSQHVGGFVIAAASPRRVGADREREHAGAHGHPVGKRRPRGLGVAQGRHASRSGC
jgi:DNA polymerase III alpha subunit